MEKILINLNDTLFESGIFSFAITLFFTIIASRLLKKTISKLLDVTENKKKFKNEREAKSSLTSMNFIKRGLLFIINAIALFIIISQIKPLANVSSTVLGATSILAVVVGFAAQESTANLVGGLFLSFFQPFVTGDNINLPDEGISGEITSIGLRHTTIKTFNNTTYVIPNSVMNSAIIENRTKDDVYNSVLLYTISYDSDVDLAKKILKDLADESTLTIEPSTVSISNLLDFSVELKVVVKTKKYFDYVALKAELNEKVLKSFNENGIIIPYPTSTIDIKH